MDKGKIVLIFSIVTISGISIYFLAKEKYMSHSNDAGEKDTVSKTNISENNKIVETRKLQFFTIENDLSKSIYAKWSNSKNIYPVTKSLAMQHGIDHEQSNVILVSRIEYEKYNLCGAIKEGEIPK